jgi:hypothetical protein
MSDPGRAPLIDLPARRLFQVIYGGAMQRLPSEAREQLRKKLANPDAVITEDGSTRSAASGRTIHPETQKIADELGIAVPDWYSDDNPWDAPPEFTVGSDE